MPNRRPSRAALRGSGNTSPADRKSDRRRQAAPRGLDATSIVIDENLDIFEFSGHTGHFLRMPVGEARFNVRRMAPAGVGELIMQAIALEPKQAPCVRTGEVHFQHDGVARTVKVEVAPGPIGVPGRRLFRVRFEEAPARKGAEALAAKPAGRRSKSIAPAGKSRRAGLKLEPPLAHVDAAELQAAYIALEEAHGEMRTSNRELVTANLELEAVNGELEISNHSLLIALEERDEAKSRRRELEDRLLQKQKLESLGVMAGGVAHDFNNILTSIIGHAGLLVERLPDGSADRGFAGEIETAGLRAANLVTQMLAYSGSGRFETAPVDLCAVVNDVKDLIQASTQAGVRLEYRFDEKTPRVDADASQIQQVVVNLVANASQAITGRGLVAVSVHPAEDDELQRAQTYLGAADRARRFAVLQVSDTGRGMDEATKSKIFDPFFTTKPSGHGLGLAAVLGIVRGHGGSIRVESKVGAGTSVQVFLPVSIRMPARPAAVPAAPALLPDDTVVVVDDQAAVRVAAGSMLKSAGVSVLTARSGAEAIEAIHASAGEVLAVVLDLTMPGMDGREALRQIRNLWPHLPVVISSGYSRPGITPSLAGYRNVSFLPKPYRTAELLEKIREAVSSSPDGVMGPDGGTARGE